MKKTINVFLALTCAAMISVNQGCKKDDDDKCQFSGEAISASFTFEIDGATVSFTNTGSDYCASSWDFGDGSGSSEENPVHTYSDTGMYQVALVVKAGNFSDTFQYPVEITSLTTPKLIFKFKFDSTQQRLNAIGQSATMPAGHAGQSPRFNGMSAHYIELSQGIFTQVGSGEVLYIGEETTAGGSNAIIFDKQNVVGDGETFFSIPIKNVTPGSYEYLRVSLAYQNYEIDMFATIPLKGVIASFVGYNTYINSFKVKDSTVTVNGNRLQGYWAFETKGSPVPVQVITGQASGTTVVNPLFNTSPIPAGSCLATGQFAQPFVITGNETEDIVITVSLSTNNSFEWVDIIPNGIFEPLEGEYAVDMGLRGLIPIVN